MTDFENIKAWIDAILNGIFGNEVPAVVTAVVSWILLLALVLVAIWGLLLVLSRIKKLWIEEFRPLFYDAREKRRAENRRRFANHLKALLDTLNAREAWQDYRFTELEAEVEAEGRRRGWSLLPLVRPTRRGLRQEKSLAAALKVSQERLILLEGEPGSGKSVACRHVALALAERAQRSRSSRSLLPVYLNLKGLVRPQGTEIDRNLIESFVVTSLIGRDRDVEKFLDDEFKPGLRDGTWLFLFDSFDELPDVLSSTEADETIQAYAQAIHDFLHGMNTCRGIVASRQFRGPARLAWPRFWIKPLSFERRRRLIRKVNLDPVVERSLLTWIETSHSDLRRMAANPMFLGLLANHVMEGHDLPESPHIVFDTYIQHRLERDADRVEQRYGIETDELRRIAEQIAFSMAADDDLGLNPTRDQIAAGMTSLRFQTGEWLVAALDALEYIKLARSESPIDPGDSQSFTFAHRRFQEYFSTCILLDQPDRVGARRLLTDARWREAVVVMCQTQPTGTLTPLLTESGQLLQEMVEAISVPPQTATTHTAGEGVAFRWPPGAIHLCGILQDGFGNRLEILPLDIRQLIGLLLTTATSAGSRLDGKWALDVAGSAPPDELLNMLRGAFESRSQWLKNAAYGQVARLAALPVDIADSIRESLVIMGARGTLHREHLATVAHLARLDRGPEFLATLRQLWWIPPISASLHVAVLTGTVLVGIGTTGPSLQRAFWTIVALSLILVSARFIWFYRGRPFTVRLVVASLLIFISITPLIAERSPFFGFEYFLWVVGGPVMAYVLIWPPLAIRSARMGRGTTVVAWPFLPLLYLLNWALVSSVVKKWLEIVKFLIFMAVLSFILWLSSRYSWLNIILVPLYIVGPILVVVATGRWILERGRWIRQLRDYHHFTKHHNRPMEAGEFARVLEEVGDSAFRAQIVRIIRVEELLVPSAGVMTAIRSYLEEAERNESTVDDRSQQSAYIDELCMLLEQVQRQVVSTPIRAA